MPRVSFAFFAVAALYGLAGMVWGNQMGASGDHSAHAAHAHLNLLGWVTLSIMGAFYALAGGRAPSRLAWGNLALSAAGAALMSASMFQLMVRQDERFVPMVIAADLSTILGMLTFIAAIFLTWRRTTRPLA